MEETSNMSEVEVYTLICSIIYKNFLTKYVFGHQEFLDSYESLNLEGRINVAIDS